MDDESVIVVGGGIAGLTASCLLAFEGIDVTLIEAHHQLGGCAGTFRRDKYIFDVGATQVAGLEVGGIHERVFRHLKLPPLDGEVLDPACVVDLLDGSEPITLWHDPVKWYQECQQQFPGSERFWDLCRLIHNSNWQFSGRDPILPVRNFWDFVQFFKALRLSNISTGFLSMLTIFDLLRLLGLEQNHRLKKFLDLQLKLYSQEPSDRTASLYGATVLQMAQAPLGLWHIQGSMQKLSDHLLNAFRRDGGNLLLRHRVVGIEIEDLDSWKVNVINNYGKNLSFRSKDIVFTLPPQCLTRLIKKNTKIPAFYLNKLDKLPKSSGAIVFYGAVHRATLPINCPAHFQFLITKLGSLFVSISRDGDGRAPIGQATITASIFSPTNEWLSLPQSRYEKRKQDLLNQIVEALSLGLGISLEQWLHKELATPKTFEYWTGRPNGIVGGIGQHPLSFGIFGLPSRTPIEGLWLCGDSIYPGEGTAGVSHSALIACRQLAAQRGYSISVKP